LRLQRRWTSLGDIKVTLVTTFSRDTKNDSILDRKHLDKQMFQ
jgi:hypothetical protein